MRPGRGLWVKTYVVPKLDPEFLIGPKKGSETKPNLQAGQKIGSIPGFIRIGHTGYSDNQVSICNPKFSSAPFFPLFVLVGEALARGGYA